MLKKLCCFLLPLLLSLSALAQKPAEEREGEVTFLTSRNVYVKFAETEGISVGDTLYTAQGAPCLVVTNKSTTSCVCVRLGESSLEKGSKIRCVIPEQVAETEAIEPEDAYVPVSDSTTASTDRTHKQRIRGRLSASSYSNLASDRDDRNRLMTRLWLRADHINDSKFSFLAQINYRQIIPTATERFNNARTSFLNVYNLAVRYDADSTLSLTLGRSINAKISSLGAIDGLQAEKYFGKFYVGAILGTRPDIENHGFNANLLEYGAYVGTEIRNQKYYGQSTIGLIEQRNAGQIDRRYAYLQHSGTIMRNLTLFSSLEMDMYQRVNGVSSSTIRLPNLFVSGTYRFGRKVNLMLSYDSRKRLLFYETFQTDIERLINDDLARQGIRARINVRPVKYLTLGASFANRFQSDQQNQSDNIHGYAAYSKLPMVGGRLSASFTLNRSNYLETQVVSIRHQRVLIKNKLDGSFFYRLAGYTFENSPNQRQQHYFGTNLGLNVNRQWALRLAAERADFNQEANYRIYFRVIRRFFGN
ncbi:MAG: hypothetical protein AAF206_19140 [Bacteroidota bacterium]